jgi:Tfp pilus assembly protein PilO
MTWLYIIAALAVLCGILFVIVRVQSGRVKKYREENEELLGEIRRTAESLAGLAALAARNKKVKEAADELRRELEETADGALADRANALFGGVRDRKGGGSGNGD